MNQLHSEQATEASDHHRSLLLVDDDAILRELVARRFARRGYVVVEAGDATAAREAVRLRSFDAVVLDRGLHGADGLDLAQEFRRGTPAMAVVLLTGHANDEDSSLATSAGVFAYLVKPCRLDALEATLDAALQPQSSSPVNQ